MVNKGREYDRLFLFLFVVANTQQGDATKFIRHRNNVIEAISGALNYIRLDTIESLVHQLSLLVIEDVVDGAKTPTNRGKLQFQTMFVEAGFFKLVRQSLASVDLFKLVVENGNRGSMNAGVGQNRMI
jgi:hypothetical protein